MVGTQYNTTSILRTIEQILGLPPLNQFDATAVPMFDCFTSVPDFTPFRAVPNNIPLAELNPAPRAIADPLLRRNAVLSARLDLSRIDACPEDVLNRILWHAVRGGSAPYPAWAVAIANAVIGAMERASKPPPNVDSAAVALLAELGMPPGAVAGLFAVGRAAGWVAHALEQVATGHLLRPRARYKGPPPEGGASE